jgi:hypothetical protein
VALPGTNVVVAGTTTGTQTDNAGNFQIVVENPASAVLEFSFIGYTKQQVRPVMKIIKGTGCI